MNLWITDVDGCLTNNRSIWDYDGYELVAFNKSDGLAISELRVRNDAILCLSGRYVEATAKRMQSWGVPYKISDNKLDFVKKMLASFFEYENVIIVGNYFNDVEILNLEHDKIKAFIPKDAIVPDAKVPNATRLETYGGQGIIREIMENYL